MDTNTIHKNVMRRVYYTFMLRLTVNRFTVHAFLGLMASLVLTQFVHFAAVYQNFKSIRVFEIDNFFMNAFLNTEAWTLLMLAVMGAICISYVRSFVLGRAHYFTPRMVA